MFEHVRSAIGFDTQLLHDVRERLAPNDRAGLGIDIDEALAAKYPIHANMAQFKDGVVDWMQSRLPDGTLWRP